VAANKTLNVWIASTTVERNLLGSSVGLAVGDFCLVDGFGLSVAVTVNAGTSTWRAIAGIPGGGHVALGGKNTADTLNRTVFGMAAVTFNPRLEATPSSVTFAQIANANWPALPTLAGLAMAAGFSFSGTSNLVGPNVVAWWRGTYTNNY